MSFRSSGYIRGETWGGTDPPDLDLASSSDMEGYFSDDDGHGPLASSNGSHRETSIVLHAGHNNPTQSPSSKSCWLAKIQEHLMLIHGTDKITRDDMAALQHLPDSTVGIMYSLFKQVRPR